MWIIRNHNSSLYDTKNIPLSISAAAAFLQKFNFKLTGMMLSKMCLEYSKNSCKKME